MSQVFLGESRFEKSSDHGHEHHGEAHESPTVMTLPLIILAIGAVFAGFLGFPHLPGVPDSLHGFSNFLKPVFEVEAVHGGAHEEHFASIFLLLIGAAIGWGGWLYGRSLGLKQARARLFARKQQHLVVGQYVFAHCGQTWLRNGDCAALD